jgi:V/A-type H+/Na+-transporting ATPase subunit I
MRSPDRPDTSAAPVPRRARRRWAPIPMQRIAVVAPTAGMRDALVGVADAGLVQLDEVTSTESAPPGEAAQRLQRLGTHDRPAQPMLSAAAPDLEALEGAGRADLLAGEAQLQQYAAGAVCRRDVAAVAGWCPADQMPALVARLGDAGSSVVAMPNPRSIDPPTLLGPADGREGGFATLVRTYGTVPYRDIDPTMWAGIAYVTMFGMMFGDVGHGMLLVGGAVMIRLGWIRRFPALRPLWMFVAAAGVAAAMFGALYGEFFGPTGVIPVLWLAPLDQPLRLLFSALAVGAVLLAIAHGVGAINRWREGGVQLALYAPSGIAGAVLFLGAGAVVVGFALGPRTLVTVGAVIGAVGVALAVVGLYAESGGGTAAIPQAAIGGFDLVVRLGANLVSFARLAAFGMTHAALGWVVWRGTVALWSHGWAEAVAAVLLFAVGNAVAFALEALVAGVQALRLEFYELFSRVFVLEGRPFRPWHIPVVASEAATCGPG